MSHLSYQRKIISGSLFETMERQSLSETQNKAEPLVKQLGGVRGRAGRYLAPASRSNYAARRHAAPRTTVRGVWLPLS